MTPTDDDVRRQRALAGRGDFLDVLDDAVVRELEPARADLLAAAAIRIRAMNAEHDAVCSDRAAVKDQVAALEARLEPGLPAELDPPA
jgi:hypothetical protein